MLKPRHAALALALTLLPAAAATAAGPLVTGKVTINDRGPSISVSVGETHPGHRGRRGHRGHGPRYEYTAITGHRYFGVKRRAERFAYNRGWDVISRPRRVWDAHRCAWIYEVSLRRPIYDHPRDRGPRHRGRRDRDYDRDHDRGRRGGRGGQGR